MRKLKADKKSIAKNEPLSMTEDDDDEQIAEPRPVAGSAPVNHVLTCTSFEVGGG